MIKAEIITIGDEILIGQITDTNSQWIGSELSKIGIQVVRKTSIGDVKEDITEALRDAESRADLIVITGGLGPTKDDITKHTLAKFFGCELAFHEKALLDLTVFFEQRGKELTETNRQQAMLPTACTYLQNTCGTAPGMWFERNGKAFVSMPGVPFEMKELVKNEVLPRSKKKFDCPVIVHKLIRTIGIGESYLSDLIQEWESSLPAHMKLAYLPSLGDLKLRLSCSGPDAEELNKEANALLEKLLPLIDKFVFGFNELPLEEILGRHLKQRGITLSTAESCTGGYLSSLITSVPGSSDYYKGSVVAYHNDVKIRELGVSVDTIQTHGAVSEETVRKMAESVRLKMNTDIGLSVSGIAGPGGGTAEKPVGTVWIAYADEKKVVSKKLQLGTMRANNIRLSSYALMNLMRLELELKPDSTELWEMRTL